MSSSAWSAARLPRVRARLVLPPPAAVRSGGRHLATETPELMRIVTPGDLRRDGRHVESEWSRELHDPRRDEVDALDWLGFSDD